MVVKTGGAEELLLTSRGQRPGRLLIAPQCTDSGARGRIIRTPNASGAVVQASKKQDIPGSVMGPKRS